MARLQEQTIGLPECGEHNPSLYCLTQYFLDPDLGIGLFNHAESNIDSRSTIFAYSLLILIFTYIPLLKTRASISYQRCKMWLQNLEVPGNVIPLRDGVRSVFGYVVETVYPQFLLDKVIWHPDAPRWVKTLRKLFSASALKIRNDWQAIVLRIFYLGAWIFYFLCFRVFMRSLYLFIENQMVSFDWTFGQIVGITVWAEPLVEYAYLEISEFACVVKSVVLCLYGQLLI